MLYVSSSCIKKNNIAEVVQQLAKNGIRNIELSGGTDYYDGIEHDLKALKKEYHLNYVCHAYFPPPKEHFVANLASCNDRIYRQSIEHYVNCIDILKRLNCKVLSIHAGFLVGIAADEIGRRLNNKTVYDEEEAYRRFCAAYERLSKLCAENGIALFLENNVISAENYAGFNNHNYMMMTNYDSIMRMKEQLEFQLLLDLGHLYVSANTLGLDYTDECEKLKGYVQWIHLSENNGIFDEHKPLKSDGEIMKAFRKMDCQNITLETAGTMDEILSSVAVMKEATKFGHL